MISERAESTNGYSDGKRLFRNCDCSTELLLYRQDLRINRREVDGTQVCPALWGTEFRQRSFKYVQRGRNLRILLLPKHGSRNC